MQPSYELFDHTADVGVRARAATLPDLVMPATEGLYSVIGQVVATDQIMDLTIERTGDNAAELLRDYLAEVLFRFEHERQRVMAARVDRFDAQCLLVHLRMAVVDDQQSAYHREVKAVTYHELAIREIPGGWEATYIVDI